MSKEEIYKFYNGKDNILNVSLKDLKKGIFSDCDTEFQLGLYNAIKDLQQQLKQKDKAIDECIELLKDYKTYATMRNDITVNKAKGDKK